MVILYLAIVTLESVLMLATAGDGRDATSVRRAILWTNLGYVSILYISSILDGHSVPGYSNARECFNAGYCWRWSGCYECAACYTLDKPWLCEYTLHFLHLRWSFGNWI